MAKVVKQERARRTRQHVLDAAALEFAAHGYAHTTLNAVADRIGMTKGALYGHFASKDDLADALVESGREFWQSAAAKAEASGDSPMTRLGAVVRTLARELHEGIRLRAAFRLVEERLLAGDRQENLLLDIQGHMTDLVELARREGEINPCCPASDVVEVLLALVSAVQSATLSAAGISPVEWLEKIWHTLREVLHTERPPVATCTASDSART